MSDACHALHTFDADRPFCLFLADAYQGGLAWEMPSSPTLGLATLWGYRTATVTVGEGEYASEQQVIVERALSTMRTYLVPWPGESEANFARRRSLAVYVGLVEPIVDEYIDAIVPHVTRNLGSAEQYLRNLDGDGRAWADFVGSVALQAALDGVTAVVIDAPKENPATTRAEELALGIGLRATVVPHASWAWMRLDDENRLREFAYVDAPAVDTTTPTQIVRLWVWRAADVPDERGEVADPGGWRLYETSVATGAAIGDIPRTGGFGKLLREGTLHPSLKGRLPITFAYHRRVETSRVPRGKSLAAGPASMSRQIFQILSMVEDTQRRTPAFLSVPTRSTNGLEPTSQIVAGPDRSVPAPEGAGAPQWVTFPSESLQDLRAHAMFLVGLAYRVSGLELSADTSAQVQSGEALRVRSRGFEARAAKFAKNLADFERRAFDLVAGMLGINRAEMSATYPKRYVLGDPSELLAAAMLLAQAFGERLGEKGWSEVMRQAFSGALNLDESRLQELMSEISEKMAASPESPAQKELFAYDYDAGLVSVNEARANKGLPPTKGGEVTVLEWMEAIKARVSSRTMKE